MPPLNAEATDAVRVTAETFLDLPGLDQKPEFTRSRRVGRDPLRPTRPRAKRCRPLAGEIMVRGQGGRPRHVTSGFLGPLAARRPDASGSSRLGRRRASVCKLPRRLPRLVSKLRFLCRKEGADALAQGGCDRGRRVDHVPDCFLGLRIPHGSRDRHARPRCHRSRDQGGVLPSLGLVEKPDSEIREPRYPRRFPIAARELASPKRDMDG